MVPYNFNLIDFRSFTLVDPNKPIKTRVAGEKVKRIVFHCTDANGWTADRLSRFFVEERGFPICGYHYYVREDGRQGYAYNAEARPYKKYCNLRAH